MEPITVAKPNQRHPGRFAHLSECMQPNCGRLLFFTTEDGWVHAIDRNHVCPDQ